MRSVLSVEDKRDLEILGSQLKLRHFTLYLVTTSAVYS